MLRHKIQTKLTQKTEKTKVLTFAGLPYHESIKLDFLLVFVDCWNKQHNIYSNFKVDGNPIIQEALLENIPHSASTLTLEWLAKSYYWHGWSNFQTMTMIIVALNGIKHAPTAKNIIPDQTIHAYSNSNFTLDANVSSDYDGDSLTLNAYLDNGLPKASWQSFDPTIVIKPSVS